MLEFETELLDHGYVKSIESWGSDQAIVEAARMSTDGGFKGWGPIVCKKCDTDGLVDAEPGLMKKCPACKGTRYVKGDEGLLHYLYTHRHTTPFEMAGLVIEVQAPIFIYRQWHRHRTQSYNEMSGRYITLPDMFYIPSIARIQASRQDVINKQGSTPFADMPIETAKAHQDALHDSYLLARQTYERMLGQGVSSEVARFCLPVAQYSRMRASANLHNWLHFLTLRMDSHAQWEIRQYANVVGEMIQGLFPRTWELFIEGK